MIFFLATILVLQAQVFLLSPSNVHPLLLSAQLDKYIFAIKLQKWQKGVEWKHSVSWRGMGYQVPHSHLKRPPQHKVL